MKYLFEFSRILAFCLAGELLHLVLPLPVPSSIYGLVLLLGSLLLGIVKPEQVRETASFLTGIFPLLFVPAAVGVMELREELCAMLLPAALAVVPVTVLVFAASGRAVQFVRRRKKRNGNA